jgi:hypothetical protein
VTQRKRIEASCRRAEQRSCRRELPVARANGRDCECALWLLGIVWLLEASVLCATTMTSRTATDNER